MEIMRLDPATYKPNSDLIEGYSSCIWTERYSPFGEFQLKTYDIEKTLAVIPDGTIIGERDTKEVMRVETHSIAKDDDGNAEMTVKGRSFASFMENRVILGDYQSPWPMQKEYTVQDAIMLTIWNYMVNLSGVDVTHGSDEPFSTYGALLHTAVSDSTVITARPPIPVPPGDPVKDIADLQSVQEWWLQQGDLATRVFDMITLGKLGIRTIRPDSNPSRVVNVGADGTIYKTAYFPLDLLRIDIYNGRNRTTTPTTWINDDIPGAPTTEVVDLLEPVIFRYDAGHIEKPQYLLSEADHKNMAIVASTYGTVEVIDPELEFVPYGLNRHVLYIDAGTVDPGAGDYDEALRQIGLTELKKHNRISIIDGAISPNSPYKYGEDYFLGDYVTVMGEYSIADDMQVVEYIRTEDADGDRGYPTLVRKE